jgi:diaminohydroxyphosphoribosylaminopyrimidine deaminase/5-amino-6-(5-phosphoribosylamino)uracil reductase
VVVDSDARTPLDAQVLDDAADTLIATADDAPLDRREALRAAGAEVVSLPRAMAGLDLAALLDALYSHECYLVLVEGGATLAGGFFRSGLVNRVVGYVAPALLGDGTPIVDGLGIASIADASRLELVDVVAVGNDVRITADVSTHDGGN